LAADIRSYPELQPAEHLWPLVDEPVANRHFATLADLEAVIAERCRRLDAETIKPHTRLPLVAQADQAELITRRWYQTHATNISDGRSRCAGPEPSETHRHHPRAIGID
jgi:hypothetical protein